LHQLGDLFELNVKLRCQKVKVTSGDEHISESCYYLSQPNRMLTGHLFQTQRLKNSLIL